MPRVVEHDALAVGEERHVTAVLPVAGKLEQPGHQARAAARVDDPIRGTAEALRGGREGLGAEPQAQIATQSVNEVFVNAEQGYERKATSVAVKSRDEVRAEAVQAVRSGNFIVNAELGTTANSL